TASSPGTCLPPDVTSLSPGLNPLGFRAGHRPSIRLLARLEFLRVFTAYIWCVSGRQTQHHRFATIKHPLPLGVVVTTLCYIPSVVVAYFAPPPPLLATVLCG